MINAGPSKSLTQHRCSYYGRAIPNTKAPRYLQAESEVCVDIGTIFIQVGDGAALVIRCEEDGDGVRLVPAANTEELAEQTIRAVAELGGTLDEDGLYICTNQLQAAAHFPPLSLPTDAITVGEAGTLLWPDASRAERWERLKTLRNAGTLRVYRAGLSEAMRQYVSQAAVMQVAE